MGKDDSRQPAKILPQLWGSTQGIDGKRDVLAVFRIGGGHDPPYSVPEHVPFFLPPTVGIALQLAYRFEVPAGRCPEGAHLE